MKKHLLLFFFFAFWLPSSYASYVTGKELLENCQIALDIYDKSGWRVQREENYTQGAKAGFCKGYLIGIADLSRSSQKRPLFCLPDHHIAQPIAVVVKYLKDHKDTSNQPASRVVYGIFKHYFPCSLPRS